MEIPNLAEEGQTCHPMDFEKGLSLYYNNVRRKEGQSLEYCGYLKRCLGIFYTLQIVAYLPSYLERYKESVQRKLNYVAKLANGEHRIVQIRVPDDEYGYHDEVSYEYLVKYENLLFLETVSPLEEDYLQIMDYSPSGSSCLRAILPMSETGIENLSLALEYYEANPQTIRERFKHQLAEFFLQVLETGELLDAIHEARDSLEVKLSDLISLSKI